MIGRVAFHHTKKTIFLLRPKEKKQPGQPRTTKVPPFRTSPFQNNHPPLKKSSQTSDPSVSHPRQSHSP
jgi:hypothetical protein